MRIAGLQRLTLLDYPGRVACTVFLPGCGLRCPFCHNAELLGDSIPSELEEEDFFSFLERRRGLLEGVAVSGGEPCLHRELPEFIARIRDMGFAVKLDTNGCHPEMVRGLLGAGLVDYVAMDIKNSPERYAETVGLSEFALAPVRETIALLMEAAPDYEFRTTVVRELHEARDFQSIARMLDGAARYFLQPFVDRETVPRRGLHAPRAEELAAWADLVRPRVREVQIRGVDS